MEQVATESGKEFQIAYMYRVPFLLQGILGRLALILLQYKCFFTYGYCQPRTAHASMLTSAELVSNLQTHKSPPIRFETNAEQLFIVCRNNCGVSEWQHRKACLRETTAFISILSFHKNHGHKLNINYCCEMRK